MSIRPKFSYADWLLGGVMLLLCMALTALQYRWTGEVARAEMTQLRAKLAEQAQAFAREFDAELNTAREKLMPEGADLTNPSLQTAVLTRFKEWQKTQPRPIFSRIALAEAVDDRVQLSLLDPKAVRFVPTNWPTEWATLQSGLENKARGGPPPPIDRRGTIVEFPIFGSGPGHMEPRDDRWLIVELDLAYVREHWLPELVAKHLNPIGSAVNEARITTQSADTLFATTNAVPREGVISVRFNRLGRASHGFEMPPQWLLETWQRPGVLEATVAAARRRNLGIAVGINLLMLATGMALVHHTRRSRRLAEQQMNFVANVSHELRTPLTVIRGAAHNLKRGVVHERSQIEQYSGLIIEHTEQLTDMIEQLLELAGVKKNRNALVHKPVELAQVLKDAIAATEHDTKAAGCSVQFQCPDELPRLNGDAAALRRAFQNLIANAAKHGGEGGWIAVSAQKTGESGTEQLEVRVADRGPGVPASEQDEIFKPFVRGARAQAKQIRGSGLGLSLVREIVEQHQGSVSLESQPGHGATFIVRLPVMKESL